MDSRHAQTQSYEQWDFMKREIRASRTCSVTQDVAQQAEVRQLRGGSFLRKRNGIRTLNDRRPINKRKYINGITVITIDDEIC